MLDVVRSADEEIGDSRSRRAGLLRRDLALLLGRTPTAGNAQAGGQGDAAESGSPLPPYCGLVDRLQALVLPRTAEAQVAAQGELKPQGITVSASALSGWAEVSGAAATERSAKRRADKYLVEVHKKFSIAAACIPFVLIAVVLALRFPRGGMGLVIGGAMAVFSIFWVGLTAGEALADKGHIRPWIAMWSPNMVLLVTGIVGLIRVNRETGSTRGGDWQEISQWATDLYRRVRRAG